VASDLPFSPISKRFKFLPSLDSQVPKDRRQ
jgi:hypothetical protein